MAHRSPRFSIRLWSFTRDNALELPPGRSYGAEAIRGMLVFTTRTAATNAAKAWAGVSSYDEAKSRGVRVVEIVSPSALEP